MVVLLHVLVEGVWHEFLDGVEINLCEKLFLFFVVGNLEGAQFVSADFRTQLVDFIWFH